jgi:hypothetical protein
LGKIKVRRLTKQHIHVHNDLAKGAQHFKERALERLANNDEVGIAYDILAELIFVAFSTEARLNFLGSKLVLGWKERAPFQKKLKLVLSELGLAPDFAKRPYSVIATLKDLRDSLAHGKPAYFELEQEIVVDAAEAANIPFPRHSWVAFCTKEFAIEAFEDAESIWNELLKTSKLTTFETVTRQTASTTFIEHV